MSNDELRRLSKQERQVRNVMDVMKDFVRNYQEHLDKRSLAARIQKLDEIYDLFCEVRMRIDLILEDTDFDEDFVDADESEEDHAVRTARTKAKKVKENEKVLKDFINEYFAIKQSMQGLMIPSGSSSSVVPVESTNQQGSSLSMMRVKLPELKLPTFGGHLRDWITFRDTFKNLISDNAQLTEIDKFTYLRTSLSGEALQEIGSIELSVANYSIAWKSLESRYENKKLLVKSHLDALLSIEPMERESFESLNHVINDFDKHLQMLHKLGENTFEWSTILAHILASKLDTTTLRLWETEHRSREVPRYTAMLEFLKNHCIVLQSVTPERSSSQQHDSKKKSRAFNSYAGSTQIACPFCGEPQHQSFQCKKFKSMKMEERRNAVKTGRLCFNCLSRGHISKSCSRSSCRLCGQRHHTMLHQGSTQTGSNSSAAQSNKLPQSQPNSQNPHSTQTHSTSYTQKPTQTLQPPPNQPNTNSFSVATSSRQVQTPPNTDTTTSHNAVLSASETKASRTVLLATALVILEDHYRNSTLARALLDSGSQLCFISENLSQQLRFKRSREILSISGIGQATKKCKQSVVARIRSRVSGFVEEETLYVLPQVTQDLPTTKINTSSLALPQGVILADSNYFEPGSIDIIIGAGLFFDVLTADKFKLGEDGPAMQNTEFGWIICGRIPNLSNHFRPVVASACSERVDDLLTKFWELETCRSNSIHSVEESACEVYFDRTTVRDSRSLQRSSTIFHIIVYSNLTVRPPSCAWCSMRRARLVAEFP
ncbi:uncharacterized protein LOC131688138 [Topomyia yanbarensis]|uniref:uncharacterized protein LOC131688138 n=1 Tax=Topomyia yanbarensis TaxID=2498891 RepID=UPI00273B6361|nr:uncharacterized protein LOC131688138 [Topomyia yanbarensis]